MALALAPQFSFAGSSAGGAPIEYVRMTPTFADGSGAAGEVEEESVNSTAASWTITADIDLGGRDSASIVVLLELLSGSGVVEWSARVGPISVNRASAGDTTAYEGPATLVRGPIGNLAVESLNVQGPSFMYGSTSIQASATVTAQGPYTVMWSSSAPDVAGVDAVGDTVMVHAYTTGTAWIRAGAGFHADSFLVAVDEVVTGPPAFMELLPDSALLIVGATRAWQAIAYDSTELEVDATFAWQSLDPQVATVSASGVVSALAVGRARIVASVDALADTAIAIVDTLPAGADIVWQGGTPGFEDDWFTADNWSPARVPTASDVVYFGVGATPARLTANAEVGGIIADTAAYYTVDLIGATTLTVHGDAHVGYIYGDSTSSLVMDGVGVTLRGYALPPLVIRGQVSMLVDAYVYGDVLIESGATFDVGAPGYFGVTGDLTVLGGGLVMSEDTTMAVESLVSVGGDILFDGGDSNGNLLGGYIALAGDFTVTAATCTAFRPTNVAVEFYSDTSSISLGCAGPDGNRFWDLWMYSDETAPHVIELLSDLVVANEIYLEWNGTYPAHVVGNGFTVRTRNGSVSTSTFDHAFLEVEPGFDEYFYMDSLVFTGMAGETRPQVLVNAQGDSCPSCYDWQEVYFDTTAAGPYIELNDLTADADSVVWYMSVNPGDGPQRTVTSGGAAVYWADVSQYVLYWSGSGQTGSAMQPLPDSLIAEVRDYAGYAVAGATVDWRVNLGDGTLSPVSSVSNAQGLATTEYTLGSENFPEQEIVATTAGAVDSAFFYVYVAVPVAPEQAIAPRRAVENDEPRVTPRVAPGERTGREPRALPAVPARPQPRSTLDNGERR